MSFEFRQERLIEFLKNEKLKPTLQKETDLVYITEYFKGYEFMIFFIFMDKSQLLQLIGYLPFQIQEKTKTELARLLHFLNKEIDMPGFGMDENENVIFYRSLIPFLEGKADKRLIRLHLDTLKLASRKFMPLIGATIQGSMTLNDIKKR